MMFKTSVFSAVVPGMCLWLSTAFVLADQNLSRADEVAGQTEQAKPDKKNKKKKKKNKKEESNTEFDSAFAAQQVGYAFYRSRDFKKALPALEAAFKLAENDMRMKMEVSQALLACYQSGPKFAPYRDAAEFIIDNHYHDSAQSNIRTSLLSVAASRGEIDGLVERYESELKKDPDHWVANFVLSEIYSGHSYRSSSRSNPKRAIELINQVNVLEAKRFADPKINWTRLPTPKNVATPSRRMTKVAQQYLKLRQYPKAAEAFEEAAKLHEKTAATNYKEAASAALRGGDQDNAFRLAVLAEEAPPEGRGDSLLHHLHRGLGDIFQQLDKPEKAIPHYRIAIEKTEIAGYLKDTKASLLQAKEKLKSRE